jgi:hypothetical protein
MVPTYYNEFFVYYCINVLAYGVTMICSRYFMYINNSKKIKKHPIKIKKHSKKIKKHPKK